MLSGDHCKHLDFLPWFHDLVCSSFNCLKSYAPNFFHIFIILSRLALSDLFQVWCLSWNEGLRYSFQTWGSMLMCDWSYLNYLLDENLPGFWLKLWCQPGVLDISAIVSNFNLIVVFQISCFLSSFSYISLFWEFLNISISIALFQHSFSYEFPPSSSEEYVEYPSA